MEGTFKSYHMLVNGRYIYVLPYAGQWKVRLILPYAGQWKVRLILPYAGQWKVRLSLTISWPMGGPFKSYHMLANGRYI